VLENATGKPLAAPPAAFGGKNVPVPSLRTANHTKGPFVEVAWFTGADYGRVTVAEQQVMDRLVAEGQMVG
jgi:hypothetical protein